MPKVRCDLCEKGYTLSNQQRYDLEKEGYLIYCRECAEKLNITSWKAKKDKIKIYKMT